MAAFQETPSQQVRQNSQSITMVNVRVHFPRPPYDQQIGVAKRILLGVSRLQNVGLELPTGCGKTMSMLCSLAAFQVEERHKLKDMVDELVALRAADNKQASRAPVAVVRKSAKAGRRDDKRAAAKACGNGEAVPQKCHGDGAGCGDCAQVTDIEALAPTAKKTTQPSAKKGRRVVLVDLASDEDDEFREMRIPRFRNGVSSPAQQANKRPKTCGAIGETCVTSEPVAEHVVQDEVEDCPIPPSQVIPTSITAESVAARRKALPNAAGEYGPTRLSREYAVAAKSCPIRVPKIFYTSRTHIQLAQVCQELKKTAYHDARTIVLSSREQSCIHGRSKQYKSKTALCLDLHDPKTHQVCMFHQAVKQADSHEKLNSMGVGSVVDVRTLVMAGRRHRFCPYFAARDLMTTSDIVVCPVNYIIDPLIRKSMDLHLSGEIVLFDEAHGLEDMCREVASTSVIVPELEECIVDCENIIKAGLLPDTHTGMVVMLKALINWINMNTELAARVPGSSDEQFILRGTDLLASLQLAGITQEITDYFIKSTQTAIAESKNPEAARDDTQPDGISSGTITVCERLALVLGFLFANYKDYVGAIERTRRRPQKNTEISSKTFSQPYNNGPFWGFKLLCQNSAIVFRPIADATRSIILASATLSPIPAMAAELGITLHHAMSSDHVVPTEQMWIGCLGTGPTGEQLSSSYHRSKESVYMDEVGRIVLDVSQRIPYGVLVFVTAYWLLEMMVSRWKETGLWAELGRHKVPLCELRDGAEFVYVLETYYKTLETAKEDVMEGRVSVGNGCTGPLLVAVMRAKISEGYNFADEAARALITVGIPFPNIHEDSVSWKRMYNIANTCNGLQHGDAWYKSQAFRALSQSLGRGLRHSKDWCVMLMVEDRLSQARYHSSLPDWIHKRVKQFHNYRAMLTKMSDFSSHMIEEMDQKELPQEDNVIVLHVE